MKLKKLFIVLVIMLAGVFLAMSVIILINNKSMENIGTALKSNTDAVIVEANMRGFSTHIHGELLGHNSTFKIQNLYTSYEDSVEKFSKIVSEIESGESKRTSAEVSEELATHKKTLSDSLILSAALKDYISEKSGIPAESLFDDVFESSTASLSLDGRHVNEMMQAWEGQMVFASNITFLLITFMLAVIALISYILFSKMISPVEKLTRIIDSISTGNLGAEIEPKLKGQKSEIGDLARAFQRTIISLKLAMKMNVPELKKEKEEISKELETMQNVLAKHALVSMTGANGAITYVNDEFVEISKYSRGELIGKSHRIINSGFHTQEFWKNVWTTIASGGIFRGDVRNRAKDGSIYWVRSIITPLFDENKKINGYMSIRTPITDKMKNIEDAIRKLERGEDVNPEIKDAIGELKTGKYKMYDWI